MSENTGKIKGLAMKAVFALVGIAILVLIAVVIITIVPRLFSSFSSVGGSFGRLFSKTEKLEIVASSQEIRDGESLILSWDSDYEEDSFYTVEYDCSDELSISILTNVGAQEIDCKEAVPLGENSSVQLIPNLIQKNSFIDSKIIVKQIDSKNGKEVFKGDTIITISNGDGQADFTPVIDNQGSSVSSTPENDDVYVEPSDDDTSSVSSSDSSNNTDTETSSNTTSGNTSTKTTNTVQTRPVTTSPANLTISNLIPLSGTNSIQFKATNTGGRSTGAWYFTYTLPTSPARIVNSPLQLSLAPGQALLITVRFDDISSGSKLIVVTLDPQNILGSTTSDNQSTTYINISGSSQSNDYYNDYSSNNNGDDSDLELVSMKVGRVTGSGRFIEDDNIDSNEDPAVRFVVENNGDEYTGGWYYEIRISGEDTITSRRQSSLAPGRRVTITEELGNLRDDKTHTIRLELDPDDDIDEEDEGNNRDSETLRIND